MLSQNDCLSAEVVTIAMAAQRFGAFFETVLSNELVLSRGHEKVLYRVSH